MNDNFDFYKIVESSTDIKVVDSVKTDEMPEKLAVLNDTIEDKNYRLERIITSPMRENSAIIYLYTAKGE